MIRISIPPEAIEMLRNERYHHPHPLVQRKMEALLLKSQNLPHQLIALLVGVCPNTLRTYFEQYRQGGVEGLKELHFYKPKSALMAYRETIEGYLQDHPPATVKEAAALIRKKTGIQRSLTPVRVFLQRIGLARRKVAAIPAKADVDQQEAFKTQRLEPRIEEARQGERTVFFIDAAHFVFAPFLGYVWSKTRLFVKAPSGRKRFNVLGALNAITHELVTVTNDAYINAQSVCMLLRELAQKVQTPITLVLDNARYQRCQAVQDLAETLKIELLFLPSYSPNLNLIERLWKFTKKCCLYNRYYPDFSAFSHAIGFFLNSIPNEQARDLNSLLTLNFQTFPKQTSLLAA